MIHLEAWPSTALAASSPYARRISVARACRSDQTGIPACRHARWIVVRYPYRDAAPTRGRFSGHSKGSAAESDRQSIGRVASQAERSLLHDPSSRAAIYPVEAPVPSSHLHGSWLDSALALQGPRRDPGLRL